MNTFESHVVWIDSRKEAGARRILRRCLEAAEVDPLDFREKWHRDDRRQMFCFTLWRVRPPKDLPFEVFDLVVLMGSLGGLQTAGLQTYADQSWEFEVLVGVREPGVTMWSSTVCSESVQRAFINGQPEL